MPDPSRLDAILARFPGPVRLTPSPTKWLLVLLICIGFTAIGVAMVRSGDANGWWCGFFALGIPVAAIMMLPGAAGLVLDAEGFEVTSLYRMHRTRWADTDGFDVARLPPRGHKMVVYDNVTYQRRALAQFNVGLVGRNAALSDTYGLKHEALAELMTRWRARALRTNSAARMEP
jgi:hypothetical protein